MNEKSVDLGGLIHERIKKTIDERHSGRMQVRMQGYLCKKSGDHKNKKWKSNWFVLQNENGEDRLYIFENPKRTKPRGLIDLSCSYLYQV